MAISGVSNNPVYQGSGSDVAVKSANVVKVEQQNSKVISGGKSDTDTSGERFSIMPKPSELTQDQEAIRKAIEKINKQMANTECQYGIHEATNRVTIKIVDKESREIIREFPPEETLEMIAKAWELAGILVDEKR